MTTILTSILCSILLPFTVTVCVCPCIARGGCRISVVHLNIAKINSSSSSSITRGRISSSGSLAHIHN